MRLSHFVRHTSILRWAIALAILVFPRNVSAQWQLGVGAETPDMGTQAFAFLPNEIWIHASDAVTWTSNTDEPHTVTFLKVKPPPAQARPSLFVGCPGNTPSGGPFDGTACVNSGFPFLSKGQSFTVTFPSPGNFKLTCLLHEDMTGTVHVLSLAEALPHDQGFYNDQGAAETRALLTDRDAVSASGPDLGDTVKAGIGEVNATGGGKQTRSVLRFLHGTIVVRVGDTVEWTNDDSITPHTVTFGKPPANPTAVTNFVTDSDGALHATLASTSDAASSGLIVAAPQEHVFLPPLVVPQAPLGTVRVRVTFNQPGTYSYQCLLHAPVGMAGQVIVVP